MNRSLFIVFLDAEGKKRQIRIDEPRPDLTEADVLAAMNTILARNIFDGPALVSADSAYIVTTTTEDINLDQAV